MKLFGLSLKPITQLQIAILQVPVDKCILTIRGWGWVRVARIAKMRELQNIVILIKINNKNYLHMYQQSSQRDGVSPQVAQQKQRLIEM